MEQATLTRTGTSKFNRLAQRTMTPAARIASSIELLDKMLSSWHSEVRIPADRLIDQYFRSRRYIGSKDRGSISELVYWALRNKAVLDWWCTRQQMPMLGRTLIIAALVFRGEVSVSQLATLFDGSKYSPLPLTDREWQFAHLLSSQKLEHDEMPLWVKRNFQQWMEPLLKNAFGSNIDKEVAALNEQAPTDLRANTLQVTRDELLKKLKDDDIEAEATSFSPVGIRLTKRVPVFGLPYFKQGMFEMQDEGSQVVAQLVDAEPGHKVIDFCAGAGGKTLCLAAQMKNKGRILAWDTSAKRLSQLPTRLRRAGVFNTEWRVITSENDAYVKRHKLTADRVLLDVPCSGSGTWRRNPDLKWRFTEEELEDILDTQKRILTSAARLVKPGGRLIYATCSVFRTENEEQIDEFLQAWPNFRVVCAQKIWNKNAKPDNEASTPSYLSLTPHQDGTDGFFAAVLERTAV